MNPSVSLVAIGVPVNTPLPPKVQSVVDSFVPITIVVKAEQFAKELLLIDVIAGNSTLGNVLQPANELPPCIVVQIGKYNVVKLSLLEKQKPLIILISGRWASKTELL